jgi:hypothetical protein
MNKEWKVKRKKQARKIVENREKNTERRDNEDQGMKSNNQHPDVALI